MALPKVRGIFSHVREYPPFSHGCEGRAACAPRHQRGYSLFEENTPFESPRERQGASPSTPDIAGMVLEELHTLRNRARCTWLRYESLRFVTARNRALLS